MDPATIALLLGGSALLSSGGSLAGGLISSRGTGSEDIRRRNPDPLADPLLGGLTTEALLGLGQGEISQSLFTGSPINQLIGEINRTDTLNDKQKRRAVAAMRWYSERGLNPYADMEGELVDAEGKSLVPPQIKRVRGHLINALRLTGIAYGREDFDRIVGQEQRYIADARAFQERALPIAQQIREARLAGQLGLAQSGATAAQDIDTLASQFEPQIAQQFQDERNRVLQAANAGRFNPGAALGRLGETQALTQRTSAIQQALQLLGGRQAVIGGALAPAQNLAQAVSAQRQGSALTLANIGAAQQQAMMNLGQQRNENQAAGVAGGANQIGSFLQTLALLGALGGKGPGTTSNTGEADRTMEGLREEVGLRGLGTF